MKWLKNTKKTKVLLWLADKLERLVYWLKDHCDYEAIPPYPTLSNTLIEDSFFTPISGQCTGELHLPCEEMEDG